MDVIGNRLTQVIMVMGNRSLAEDQGESCSQRAYGPAMWANSLVCVRWMST